MSEIHKAVKDYALYISELNKLWTPHSTQILVGRPIIQLECKEVFVQCGRNWGKTELAAYLLWRWAQTNPGSENYFFAPEQKQAKEIVWATRRITYFGPESWIEQRNETEMRIRFRNGSFIKVDGSDNVDSYRGVKPKGLTIFDEFKDFRREFYEAYDPNRAAHDSPLVIFGTPPGEEGIFTELAASFQEDPKRLFFKFPTQSNPHISTEWLERKKADYTRKGELDVWMREYQAEFIRGGASKIFPMLQESIIQSHDTVMQMIYRDRRKLQFFLWCDPAAASCFAILFVAFNPYTKTVYVLDEIYETNQSDMTVRQIWPRAKRMRDELYTNEEAWRMGYDEAETWFMNEVVSEFGDGLEPTQKMKTDKIRGLSMIKDILLDNRLIMSDRCKKLFWELDICKKDDKGKIIKANDHLIDCLRYILAAYGWDSHESTEVIKEHDEMWRGEALKMPQGEYEEWGY